MNLDIDNLMSLVKSLGVDQLALIAVEDIQFNDDFRMYCEQNTCGTYNKNWMCPPAVGPINALKENALKYKHGLLFQTVYQLEDSFDIEGMQDGTAEHTKILRRVVDNIKSTGVFKEFLPLNIGPCTYCGRCTFLDGQECRFPEEAIASVEAYGIDVMALEKSCGMSYNNDKNTISCVSLILFILDQEKHSSTIAEMVNVTFRESIGTEGECVGSVPAGSTLLQAAIVAGVHLQSACGGKGTCGKCRIILSPEDRTEPLPEEKKFLSDTQIANGVVLACKRNVESDMKVLLIQQKDVFDRKTQLGQENQVYEVAPLVHKHVVNVSVPSTSDQRSDWERLVAELPKSDTSLRFNLGIVAKIPRILRDAFFKVTVVTAGDELLAVEPGDTSARSYGLAIDIGTTTVVAYLMNLNEGKVVERGALTNPQQGAGADVLSRIAYVVDHPSGLSRMQTQVVEGLNRIIPDLCQEKGITPEEIYQAVVVGNTTMSHLFLGIDPTYLAPAPFIPGFRQAVTVKASELGLRISSEAIVTVLPIVAGYVGSDTVGVMLSGQVDRLEGIHLLVDIGTNGEIVLVGKGRILTCSTAAGPAFEGAGVKHGMRAADGAIERVKITDNIELGIIGKENEKARGICGSGLIDAISEMHKAGVIDSGGRMIFSEDDIEKLPPALRNRVLNENGSREFVLAWKEESATGENITITQKDIRGLQLAKGAVLAGVRILLNHLGVGTEDIDMIHLAGAFGNYIAKESALGIGLLPQVSLDKIHSIGNAAGNGAQMALLSTFEMERANSIARDAEHIELSTEKIFQYEFLDSLALGQSY